MPLSFLHFCWWSDSYLQTDGSHFAMSKVITSCSLQMLSTVQSRLEKINEAIWKEMERHPNIALSSSSLLDTTVYFPPWGCGLKNTPLNKPIFKICLPGCRVAKGEIWLTNSVFMSMSSYLIVLAFTSEWDWEYEANTEAASCRWYSSEKVSGESAATRHALANQHETTAKLSLCAGWAQSRQW